MNILFHMSLIADEIPKGFIIFADDPGGNKFLMDLTDSDFTPVYYYDRVRLFKRSKKKANTYGIADSFTDFVNMLRPMPEDYE